MKGRGDQESFPRNVEGSRPRVLLVDDQPARLLTYESLLEGVGVGCVRAVSGTQALERLLQEEFAVIVLDVSMPDMDGFEVARQVRGHPRFEHTPIIFVTGVNISEIDRLRGYEVGGIDYIQIPLVPEIFRSKVALLVELYLRKAQLKDLNQQLESARSQLETERDHAVSETFRVRKQAEDQFQVLLSHPTEHTILIGAVRNQAGGVMYWRCLDANTNALSFLNQTREALMGKRLDQVLGERAEPLAALSSMVLVKRAPHFYEAESQGKRFSNVLFPVGEDTVLATGVSIQRRAAMQAVRDREARAEALLQLAEVFRLKREPADIAFSAAEILGRTLQVSRCGYGTIDREAETITIERDWNAHGIHSIAGVLHFRDYGTYIDELKRGETVVCVDAEQDPRTAATVAMLRRIQVQAFVNMPVIEQEGAVALLYLNHRESRAWPEDELTFIRDFAERTRVAVERRRNEQVMAADLECMGKLRDLAAGLIANEDPCALFEDVLTTAVFVAGAEAGSIQLLDAASGDLLLAAARGLDPVLVEGFGRVRPGSSSSCGQALAAKQRVFLDFEPAPGAVADKTLELLRSFGLRCGQSTPLVGRSGRMVGMFSTHWRQSRTLKDRDQKFLDLLAGQAADLIERHEAARHKDEFIAMLSHELRNPLVPIRNGVALLGEASDPRELLATIQPMMARQLAHLARLLDDLLDVSRITSGQLRLEKKPVTLQSILTLALDSHREQARQKSIEFIEQLRDVTRQLNVDESRMAQVISNLLSNAVKFSQPGGRITLEGSFLDPPQVQSSCLELALRDTGAGIAAEDLPRVFDMFMSSPLQVAGRTARDGLGVGLALARRIVQLHDGVLEAHSDGPGQGSRFVLRIPVEEAVAASRAEAPGKNAPAGPLDILVVDDNVDGANSMVLLLHSMGYGATARYDAMSGIAATEQQLPSIVLMDIGMPVMDGYEACRRLRQLHGAALRIIAVTGWGQAEDKRRALESGFDGHLTKPVEPDELLAIFAELTGRDRASH